MRDGGGGAVELVRGASGFFLIALALGVLGIGSAGAALVHGLAAGARRLAGAARRS